MSPPTRGLTRRAFLSRAAVFGLAVPSAAALLEACAALASRSPSPAPGSPGPSPTASGGSSGLPKIVPTPTTATYGGMTYVDGLVCRSCPQGVLTDRVGEIADEAKIPLGPPGGKQSRMAVLDVSVGAADLPAQGYRLEVGPGAQSSGSAAVLVAVRAADEAGAFYGLLSLGQLLTTDGSAHRVRAASVSDSPGFRRRGVILDTPQPPTEADRVTQLERVRFGVGYKMNFLSLPNATPDHSQPAAGLLEYCRAHFVEVLSMIGYQDWLTDGPRTLVTDYIRRQYQLGIRSFSFNWDDIHVRDPERLAAAHAAVLADLYAYVRGLDPEISLFVTLPPYGGVPNVNLLADEKGIGERYLAAMRERIPPGVEVFWTGDGGVFSDEVTADAARAYGAAVGHGVALWDNNALWSGRHRLPVAGRAANLPSVIDTYMGNMAGEDAWPGDNGQFALRSALEYTWNPPAYARPARLTPSPSALPMPPAPTP